MNSFTNPIDATLPFDSEIPPGRQSAYVATVRILIPREDRNGTPVTDEACASDYVAETLRGQFLDWAYVDGQTPRPVDVCEPYVEGTFDAPI